MNVLYLQVLILCNKMHGTVTEICTVLLYFVLRGGGPVVTPVCGMLGLPSCEVWMRCNATGCTVHPHVCMQHRQGVPSVSYLKEAN